MKFLIVLFTVCVRSAPTYPGYPLSPLVNMIPRPISVPQLIPYPRLIPYPVHIHVDESEIPLECDDDSQECDDDGSSETGNVDCNDGAIQYECTDGDSTESEIANGKANTEMGLPLDAANSIDDLDDQQAQNEYENHIEEVTLLL